MAKTGVWCGAQPDTSPPGAGMQNSRCGVYRSYPLFERQNVLPPSFESEPVGHGWLEECCKTPAPTLKYYDPDGVNYPVSLARVGSKASGGSHGARVNLCIGWCGWRLVLQAFWRGCCYDCGGRYTESSRKIKSVDGIVCRAIRSKGSA
jgi:hypothetical protein